MTEARAVAERIVGELIGKNVEFVQRRSPTWLQLRITEALLTVHAAARLAMREEAAQAARQEKNESASPSWNDACETCAEAIENLKVEEG